MKWTFCSEMPIQKEGKAWTQGFRLNKLQAGNLLASMPINSKSIVDKDWHTHCFKTFNNYMHRAKRIDFKYWASTTVLPMLRLHYNSRQNYRCRSWKLYFFKVAALQAIQARKVYTPVKLTTCWMKKLRREGAGNYYSEELIRKEEIWREGISAECLITVVAAVLLLPLHMVLRWLPGDVYRLYSKSTSLMSSISQHSTWEKIMLKPRSQQVRRKE